MCQYDISLKNQEILELGPGNSIALALNCLCCGSKKYWMADKYPRILKNNDQKKNLLEHIAYFEDKYHCSLNNYINKKNMELNESFLVYIQNGVEDLSDIPSSSIDIILSIRELTNNNLPIFTHLIYILIFYRMTTGRNTGVPYAKIRTKS